MKFLFTVTGYIVSHLIFALILSVISIEVVYSNARPVDFKMGSILVNSIIISKDLTLEKCLGKVIALYNNKYNANLKVIFEDPKLSDILPMSEGGVANSGNFAIATICSDFYDVKVEYSQNFIIIYRAPGERGHGGKRGQAKDLDGSESWKEPFPP